MTRQINIFFPNLLKIPYSLRDFYDLNLVPCRCTDASRIAFVLHSTSTRTLRNSSAVMIIKNTLKITDRCSVDRFLDLMLHMSYGNHCTFSMNLLCTKC